MHAHTCTRARVYMRIYNLIITFAVFQRDIKLADTASFPGSLRIERRIMTLKRLLLGHHQVTRLNVLAFREDRSDRMKCDLDRETRRPPRRDVGSVLRARERVNLSVKGSNPLVVAGSCHRVHRERDRLEMTDRRAFCSYINIL